MATPKKKCGHKHHLNTIGLHTPYLNAWNSCYKQEPREPNENPSNRRTCTCGKRFDSEVERDAHCARNVERGAHGRTGDELETLGGAHVWVNPTTGRVLQARAYPLPHQGQGTVSSTRSEAATVVYATLGLVELCSSRDRQLTRENKFTTATLTTDSQATVGAYESQVLNFTTAPKISKSPIQDYMHDMRAIEESLRTSYETQTHLIHNHNEHSRKWDNEARDDLACRANQACDRAAKKVAAVIDQRFQHHGPGHGGIAMLSKNGSTITDDIKTIITEKRTQDLLSLTSHATERQPQHDQPDQLTIDMASGLMDDEGACSAGRKTLGRGRWTMLELRYAAERDKNGGALKRILNACGKYSTLCPYCFNTATGEGKEDHPNHAAEECAHKSANAARTNLEAKTIERQWREGAIGKMNKNVYIHTEGDTIQHPGDTLERTDEDEDKLTHISQRDVTTGTQRSINIYNHQVQTASKMHKNAGTGVCEEEERIGIRHDIADLIWTAHKDHFNPSHNPKLRYTHLAADTPTPLLIWIRKYTRITCQHMTSPLFLNSGAFTEPPTLMPNSMTHEQKERWKMREQRIYQENDLEPDWSTVPWRNNGILALTSGIPSSKPDPSAHTLASKAI